MKMEKEEERGVEGGILFDWNLWARALHALLQNYLMCLFCVVHLLALITHEHYMYYIIAHTHKVQYNEFQYSSFIYETLTWNVRALGKIL
jgi:hypothetical protein